MKQVKVSLLIGAALDYTVAQCEGKKLGWKEELLFKDALDLKSGVAHSMIAHYRPSSNWRQGGPIVERELIDLQWRYAAGYLSEASGRYWQASIVDDDDKAYWAEGPTPLIAAMRCYVTMKLGNEVEIPDDVIADS